VLAQVDERDGEHGRVAEAEGAGDRTNSVGALVVGRLGLFGYRLGSIAAQATEPLVTLRELHSGHVVDYVTSLTVGLAAIGGVCALSLT
jgi:hypothetical protein